MVTQKLVNDISYKILSCAIEVNKMVGAGLLESVYQACLVQEMRLQGLKIIQQAEVPIIYKGVELAHHLRLDILVENLVIVELKAVDIMLPIFQAQLLTYLKLSQKPKGLLINFNTTNIINSTIPLVTEVFANLPKS